MYSLLRDKDDNYSILFPDESQENYFLVYLGKFTKERSVATVVLRALTADFERIQKEKYSDPHNLMKTTARLSESETGS